MASTLLCQAVLILLVWLNLCVASLAVPQEKELLAKHRHDNLRTFISHGMRPLESWSCLECAATVDTLKLMQNSGESVEDIEQVAIDVCTTFDLFPEDVCTSMVKLASPGVLYVLNTTEYSDETVCGWLVGVDCDSNDLDPWTIQIPGDKPEPSHPEPQQPVPSVKKILHITDLHVDLMYDEGSAAVCDHPLCCRGAFGMPGEGELAAGHWGTIANCDIPLRTLDNLLSQAAEVVSPDLVYMTGDIPAHDVWEQNHATNLAAIATTMELIRQYFPGIPVVNNLGNHASAPVNTFVVPAAYDDGWNNDWLYNPVADLWAEWLPDSALANVRRGGFFQYSPMPGLRVVSLNMNYCGTQNWWLLVNNVDPTGQLQWLVETLSAAEAAGEAVHILGHIPSGTGSCDHVFSHVFNQIVYRYESTIRALFFGHTHHDSFTLYYDEDNYTRPVAASFITGSGTTNENHHPAFKVFEVDAGHDDATWSVVDAIAYNTNVTQANMEGLPPVYKERYSTKDSYGVTSMTPASMHDIVLRMVTQEGLYEQHMWNVNNNMIEVPASGSCDANCLKDELCDFVKSDSSDHTACNNLRDYIDSVTSS